MIKLYRMHSGIKGCHRNTNGGDLLLGKANVADNWKIIQIAFFQKLWQNFTKCLQKVLAMKGF